jgi:hypothetical protein
MSDTTPPEPPSDAPPAASPSEPPAPIQPIRLRPGQTIQDVLPQEEPAIPLTPEQAKGRHTLIQGMIDRIEAAKRQGKTPQQLRQEFSSFAEQYPKFFEIVTAPGGYNKNALRTMIAMLERMGAGQLSQHEASQIVGQRLVDIYVKPKVEGANAGQGANAEQAPRR